MNDDRREDRVALAEKTSREDKMKRREETQLCSICPPNKGENASRRPKHGARKPRRNRR